MEQEIQKSATSLLHPAYITTLDAYEENAILLWPTLTAFEYAFTKFAGIAEASDKMIRNPTLAENDRLLKLVEISSNHLTNAQARFYECRADLELSIEFLSDELSKPLEQQRSSGTINQELRRHFKSLNSTDRYSQMMDAINSGDHLTVTAILGAPHVLSGFTKSEVETYTESYQQKKYPELFQRLNTLKKALKLAEHRDGLLQTEYEKAVGADYRKIAYLLEQRKQAPAAFKVAQ